MNKKDVLVVSIVGAMIGGVGGYVIGANYERAQSEALKMSTPECVRCAMLAGKYDKVDPRITEKNFPSKFKVFRFGKRMTMAEAEASIRPHGYELATAEQIDAFRARHPEMRLDGAHQFLAVLKKQASEVGGMELECVDMHIAEKTTSGKSLEIFFCDNRMTSAERVASLERQHYKPASVDDMLAVINQRRDGLDVTTDDYQIKWLPDGAYYRGKSEQEWHAGGLYVASRK